jgi:hypothetical protein
MVQGLRAKGAAQAAGWGEGKAKVEAEWVDHSPRDRVVIAYARAVARQLLMLPGSLAIKKRVLSVEQ